MLDKWKSFLRAIFSYRPQEPVNTFDCRDATAALLVRAIVVDGTVMDGELSRLHVVLCREYNLNDDEAKKLIARALELERQAVDLYSFIRVLTRELDQDGRQHVVSMLWEMSYADGCIHEFEDNFVWRASELLGVSSRDRIRLKRKAGTEANEIIESSDIVHPS